MLGPRHTRNVRQNPLVRIAAASADAMIRFAGEFGLTPVARARGSRLARLVSRPAAGNSTGCSPNQGSRRQAKIRSQTANAIKVANSVTTPANERMYISP